ncbi:hypothetical protein [uncultured Shewanella sp.]|uniref:hypothetical protein n=1 Tax=uncultured Shewanella sp. TaxID=173975 RepID=UPI0026262E08|nr:hypothetical protein [uncultured Shewanella sp.]
MSASLEQVGYLETAYRSDKPIADKVIPPKGLWELSIRKGTELPFVKPSSMISTQLALGFKPSEYLEIEDKLASGERHLYWNETILKEEKMSGWGGLYLTTSVVAKFIALYMMPFFFLFYFGLVIFSDASAQDKWEVFFNAVMFIWLPSALLWGQLVLMDKGYFTPWFLKAKKHYELNRKTGMVTLYKGNGKARFSHPFHEFDCILTSSPTPQGAMNYGLFLVHRYNGYSFGVPLHSLMPGSPLVAEYHYLWNMIQAYMDVTSPMPDILVLEEAREKDPTTKAFDDNGQRGTAFGVPAHNVKKGDLLKNPRDSHFWRNMSDDDFEQTLTAIAKNQ